MNRRKKRIRRVPALPWVNDQTTALLRLLLPAPIGILLPIADRIASRLRRLPLDACEGNRLGVAAVEHIGDAGIWRGVGEFRAIDQEAHLRGVGIVVARGEIDGMRGSVTIAGAAVRQEAFLVIGPEPRVQRFDSLLARRLHHGAPTALQRQLEQRGKLCEQRLKMIEIDFRSVRRSYALPRA